MVDPADVPRILSDAARLLGKGDLIVFGSAALAFWLEHAPRSRDVDVWCEPVEGGEPIEALMGELSWYHDKHHAYVEVWAPETFAAPDGWRERARVLTSEDHPGVRLIVPHPHDVLFAKLERMDPHDRDHIERILGEYPLSDAQLQLLAAHAPYRTGRIREADRIERFEQRLALLEQRVGAQARERRGPS